MSTIDTPRRFIVHHSASSLNTTTEQIRGWHVNEREWSDIGYHFVVLRDGTIDRGRPLPTKGAHARGANADSIGVCLVGNNIDPGQGWQSEQVASLHRLWNSAQILFPGIDLVGHRDVSSGTECPGLDVRALVLGPNAVPLRAA